MLQIKGQGLVQAEDGQCTYQPEHALFFVDRDGAVQGIGAELLPGLGVCAVIDNLQPTPHEAAPGDALHFQPGKGSGSVQNRVTVE